jgi:hypothetical protein
VDSLFSILAVLGIFVLASSCTDRIAEAVQPTNTELLTPDLKSATLPVGCILTGTITDVTIPVCVVSGTVNETETAGLLFMREEEKLARDVYAYMYAKLKNHGDFICTI